MLRTSPSQPPADPEAVLDEAAARLAEILIAQWEHQRKQAGSPSQDDAC